MQSIKDVFVDKKVTICITFHKGHFSEVTFNFFPDQGVILTVSIHQEVILLNHLSLVHNK